MEHIRFKKIRHMVGDWRHCFPRVKRKQRTLLLVRTDNIGDYILFRPALRALRQIYPGWKITLCGNHIWQSLAEFLDGAYFDDFISVDINAAEKKHEYRHILLRDIASRGYEVALNPVLSRQWWSDTLIFASRAAQRIGFAGPSVNQTPWRHVITDRYYTRLLPDPAPLGFEADRNREWLGLLGCPDEIKNSLPVLQPLPAAARDNLPSYLRQHVGRPVFFLGGSATQKLWPASSWAQLATQWAEQLQHHGSASDSFPILLAGGDDCALPALKTLYAAGSAVISLVGRTDLPQLAVLIASAPYVVSCDSCAVHMAASFGTPSLALSSGQHLRRFLPYPQETAVHTTIYPPSLATLDQAALQALYNTVSPLPMADITPDQAFQALSSLLESQ